MSGGIAEAFSKFPCSSTTGFRDSTSNFLGERRGLEPAVSCVTGGRSNQLNYSTGKSSMLLKLIYLLGKHRLPAVSFWRDAL